MFYLIKVVCSGHRMQQNKLKKMNNATQARIR